MYLSAYRRKLTTPDRAAELVPEGGTLVHGLTMAEPPALLAAIARRLRAGGTMVTTPRMDTHFLVTEFGAANLKGRSTRERALAIIELAHPKFRESLLREAEEMYLL